MPAEAGSGRSGSCSGNLRAVESLRIEDLGPPRGTGRPETGRSAESGAIPGSDESGRPPPPSPRLATTKPGGLSATARWTLFRAVPGGAFSAAPPGWLSHCYGGSASTRDVEHSRLARGARPPSDPPAFLGRGFVDEDRAMRKTHFPVSFPGTSSGIPRVQPARSGVDERLCVASQTGRSGNAAEGADTMMFTVSGPSLSEPSQVD